MFNKEKFLKDWEMKLVWDVAFKEGIIQGKAEVKAEMKKKIAKKMLPLNFAIDVSSRATSLTLVEIENLTDEDFDK